MEANRESGLPSCRACGASQPPGGGRCESCGALSGWLRPGQHFYWRRFLLHELLSARPGLVRWRAADLVTGREGILYEYAGKAELDREQQLGFIRNAAGIARQTDVFDPPECVFTYQGRPFLFRRLEPRTTLHDLAAGGKLQESDVASLFLTLLQHLEQMHRQSPPLSLGRAIDADEVLVLGGNQYRLTCIPETLDEPDSRAAQLEDLRAVAALACRLLAGSGEASGYPVAQWLDRAARLEDHAFAAALEWLISDVAPPQASSDVVRLAAMVREGAKLLEEGSKEKARRCLEDAALLANVPRVQQLLHRIGSSPKSSTAVGSQQKAEPVAAAREDSESKPQTAKREQKPEGGSSEKASVPSPPAPSPAQAAAASISSGSFKLCLKCGRKFDLNRIFCEHDGSRLVEAQNGLDSPDVRPTPDVADRVPAPAFLARLVHDEPRLERHWKWLMALAGAIAVGLVIIWISGSDRREFLRLIESNRLVSTSGPSAYAVYRKLRQARGANDSLVRELGERVKPRLDLLSDSKFDQWRRSSDIGPLTWNDMAQLEEWRSLLHNTVETQARLAYARGMAALVAGDAATAQVWFQEALRLKPGWALPLNGMGRAAFQLSKFSQAEKHYREAARADPSWAFPHFNLANLYRDVFHRFDEAEQRYRRAIELQPERCSFHLALGNFYFAKGTAFRHMACEAYRNALARVESGGCSQGDADLARRRLAKYCQP